MAGVDVLLGAAVDAVKKAQVVENAALMATVSVVRTDGTVDLTRAGDTYLRVRVLSGYMSPTVGDSVEMLRAAGGWVCLGALMTSNAPRIQSGTLSMSFTAQTSATQTVTFPKPFASTPVVTANINSGGGSARYWTGWPISASATGFSMFVKTTDAAQAAADWSGVGCSWIATTY